jgi:hypothetical protein
LSCPPIWPRVSGIKILNLRAVRGAETSQNAPAAISESPGGTSRNKPLADSKQAIRNAEFIGGDGGWQTYIKIVPGRPQHKSPRRSQLAPELGKAASARQNDRHRGNRQTMPRRRGDWMRAADFRSWHETDMPNALTNVRSRGMNGPAKNSA